MLLDKPAWWLTTIPFFLVLFGGLYSDDTAYWLSRMRIKAPFILLPMAFFLLPKINRQTYERIHLLFILAIALSSLPIVWSMVTDFSEVVNAISHGRPVNTPVSHIRYSLFVALAIAGAFIISTAPDQRSWKRKWLRILGLYLIVFIHFLAVRSGIVAIYLVGFFFIFRQLLKSSRRLPALALFLVLIAMPFLAYQIVPSFKEKLNYTVRDALQYQKMEWNAYSDAERVLSLRAGLAIASEQPFFGTGTGDLRREMQQYFYRHYDKDTFIMPHNQFISMLAGSGLVGLILFIIALGWPVYVAHQVMPDNHYFTALNLIILISLMVENTFETSVGVAFYLFFLLLGLNHMKNGNQL